MNLFSNRDGRFIYTHEAAPHAVQLLDEMVKKYAAADVDLVWPFHFLQTPRESGRMVGTDHLTVEHMDVVSPIVEKFHIPEFDQSPLKPVAEFWTVELQTPTFPTEHSQPYTTQSYFFDDSECVVCIVVTHKDTTINGGDLSVMLDHTPSLLDLFQLDEEHDELDIALRTGSVVVMNGRHYHAFTKVSGVGNFRYIKYVFPKPSTDQ